MSATAAERTTVGFAVPVPPPPQRRGPGGARAALAPRVVGGSYVVASCVSLQAGAALATTLFAALGPAGTGALRFGAAALVLLALIRPRVRRRARGFWPAVVALGIASAVTNFALYEAIARIPLGTAGTLVFLGPLTLALLAARRRLDLGWAALAAVGVVLLTGVSPAGSPAGVCLALLAAASVAASIVISRHLGAYAAGLDGLALAIAVAALVTLPVGLVAAAGSDGPVNVFVVAAVGVLGIAIPYGLEFSAIQRVGIKTHSILLSLDPAIAGLTGFVLLGQRLDVAALAGIALVVAAGTGAVATG